MYDMAPTQRNTQWNYHGRMDKLGSDLSFSNRLRKEREIVEHPKVGQTCQISCAVSNQLSELGGPGGVFQLSTPNTTSQEYLALSSIAGQSVH